MSGSLEASYRRLLRAYPSAWRAAREDEVVGTLLDAAQEEGRLRPTAVEAVDLLGHGLAHRVGAGVADVAALRRPLATAALASGSLLSAMLFVSVELVPDPRPARGFGPFASTGVLMYPSFVAAAGFALAARFREAIWCGAAVVAAAAGASLLDVVRDVARPPIVVLIALVAFALLSMTGRPVTVGSSPAAAPWRRWVSERCGLLLCCLVVGIGLSGAWLLNRYLYGAGSYLVLKGIAELMPMTLLVAVAAAQLLGAHRPGWVVAVGCVGFVWSGLTNGQGGGWPDDPTFLAALFGLVASLVVVDAMRATGRLERLGGRT